MQANITVFRFDPSKDSQPTYSDHELEVRKGMTVLDALLTIRDDIDGSLAYRCSCRAAICGSCAMVINKNNKLACNTPIEKEIETHGKLLVEPMRNMKVLKDLVVDMSPFWTHMNKLKPWIIQEESRPVPEKENMMTPEEVKRFKGTTNCISCGACHSSCPAVTVDEDFAGPASLAKLYRFSIDSRDDATHERLEEVSEAGLWWCVRCYECVKACPKDVRPGEIITDLKELSVKEGFKKDVGAKHATAFLDNIREHGTLNEEKLIFQSLGLGALKKIRLGTKMVMKGKYRPLPFFGETIEELDEIETIYRELKKE